MNSRKLLKEARLEFTSLVYAKFILIIMLFLILFRYVECLYKSKSFDIFLIVEDVTQKSYEEMSKDHSVRLQ